MRRLFRGGPLEPVAGPRIERGAVVTDGTRIAWVGAERGLDRARVGDAEVVELDGRLLLPGLCDAHLHLLLAAAEHAAVSLREVGSLDELIGRVRERAAGTPPGQWIVGHGWERRTLLPDGPPPPGALERATSEHPLFLTSKDLHSAWLNRAALAHVEALDDLPEKCSMQQVAGEPTGLFFEDVFRLREALLDRVGDDERAAALAPFARHLHACGITAVHSVEDAGDVALLARHQARPGPRVRVLANAVFESPGDLRADAAVLSSEVPGWLCGGGAKLFVDGSFGSFTAAVGEPWSSTGDHGILDLDGAELGAWLDAIRSAGVPAMIHAIGDRAVALALDGLVARRWPPGTRHRIEHAQLLSDELVARADLAAAAYSSQPSHMWADREIVERNLPGRNGRRWAYAYRTLLDRGAALLLGSDAPVETVDPWKGIAAAVTRLERDGAGPWIPEERITLGEALRAHTAAPAALHAHGFHTGVLAPGARADLVVLEPDPFEVARDDPAALWGGVSAAMTVVDGDIVFMR